MGTVHKAGYWYAADQMHIGPTSEVLVAAFEAELTDKGALLRWRLGGDAAPLGYNVYRATGEGPYRRLNAELVPYNGATSYLDDTILPELTYRYRVGFVDSDGEFLSPEKEVYVPPREATLYQNYPNPFNPHTTISFFVPGPTEVLLDIFDSRGRRIKRLVEGPYPYGRHEVEWNGRDDHGRPVASGVYFYRLRAGKKEFTRKLTLLK